MCQDTRDKSRSLSNYVWRIALEDGLAGADRDQLNDQQDEFVVQSMETLVGVLESVIQGLDEKTEH
jgi:hypothetical protein